MTLILGIPARDGIVLASDSQITSGNVRTAGTKIYHLGKQSLWAASGELAIIQRLDERISLLPNREQPLTTLRDYLAESIKESVEALLRLDFRTQFAQANPNVLLTLHPGDFVFAEFRDQPRLLHITLNGTPEWVTWGPVASGIGSDFAYALLQKYRGVELDAQRASLLAFKVIEEAIGVGAYGLSPPIDIWQITQNGVEQLQEAEVAALADVARAVRQEEIDIFRRHLRPEKPGSGAIAS